MRKTFNEELVKRRFNLKNFGIINNPDAVGEFTNPECKDFTKVYLKIKNGIIKDAKFQTIGCMAAIAFSDEACSLVKGKTIQEAKNIQSKELLKSIPDLPKEKHHCSIIGPNAVKQALENYEKKMKK
jgi:nitrogen fixation NifU-like protein